jgi:large subunit ribosomal protein L20
MPRARNRVATRARHRKILARTKGHRGKRRTNYKVAHESMMHAFRYSFEHRRKRQGDFRRLWITRINAAARLHGISYGKMIHGLKLAGIEIDRKNLADLAVRNPDAFSTVVAQAQAALPA